MAEKDWRLEFPGDFSDRYKYESDGWVAAAKYDLFYDPETRSVKCPIGTALSRQKYGNRTEYINDELGLKAVAIAFFDEGIMLIKWYRDKDENSGGMAIYSKKGWVLKNPNEIYEFSSEQKLINGKAVLVKISITFSVLIDKTSKVVNRVEVFRGDENQISQLPVKIKKQSEKDWRLILPADFLRSRATLEENGWYQEKKYDMYFNPQYDRGLPCAAGSAVPVLKYAAVVEYFNADLDLKARTYDFFDQGIRLVEWYQEDNHSDITGCGVAILRDDCWILKTTEEDFEIQVLPEKIKGEITAIKVTIDFSKNILNMPRKSIEIEIFRED